MSFPEVKTLADLNQAIDQYVRSPKSPPLKGEELNIILKKILELSGAGTPETITAQIEQGAVKVGDQIQVGTLTALSNTIKLMLQASTAGGGGSTPTPGQDGFNVGIKKGSRLSTYPGYEIVFYDETTPFKYPDDEFHILQVLAGENVNKAFYRLRQMISNGNPAVMTTQLEMFDDNGTGATRINQTPAINDVSWQMIRGIDDGGGHKGTNLTAMDIYGNFYDPDSQAADNKLGDIIHISKAWRGVTDAGDYMVENNELYYNMMIMRLFHRSTGQFPSSNLFGGEWSTVRPYPHDDTPINNDFKGEARVMFIGDGNTQFNELLERTFNKVLPNAQRKFINKGLDGTITTDWLPVGKLLTDAITEANNERINVISICLGTEIGNLPKDKFISEYQKIVDKLYESIPTLKKIVIQEIPLPIDESLIVPLNNALKDLQNTTIGTFDLYNFYSNHEEYKGSYKNPNRPGKRAMAHTQVKGVVAALTA